MAAQQPGSQPPRAAATPPAPQGEAGPPGVAAGGGKPGGGKPGSGEPGARQPGPRQHGPQERPPRPGKTARRTANVAYTLVTLGVLAGLAWVWLSKAHVKGGTLMISGALLLAAGARLLLPDDRAGLFVNRRRAMDVAAFAVLGVALLAAALVIPNPS